MALNATAPLVGRAGPGIRAETTVLILALVQKVGLNLGLGLGNGDGVDKGDGRKKAEYGGELHFGNCNVEKLS